VKLKIILLYITTINLRAYPSKKNLRAYILMGACALSSNAAPLLDMNWLFVELSVVQLLVLYTVESTGWFECYVWKGFFHPHIFSFWC